MTPTPDLCHRSHKRDRLPSCGTSPALSAGEGKGPIRIALMKANRLQVAFARRREAEHVRLEKNDAVNRYFDHWGKVTSRFETWTAPEYYEHADENLRKSREKEFKDKQLEERREKLRTLLECENRQLEEELRLFSKPRARQISTDVLQKIDRNLKEQEEDRRRLQLESKLYSRLRYGTCDDSVLFDSKTDNQAFAKLNWLDKQIENQMQREQDEKETQIRNLRLQEEATKREEYLKEREQIRESEIKELSVLQQSHMEELKRREMESSNLQREEEDLRRIITEMQNELTDFQTWSCEDKTDTQIPHNLSRIKMIIRQRSDDVRKKMRGDIDVLKRISTYCKDDSIKHLIEKFEMQYDCEIQKQSQIEAMYESEAKHNLQKWEEVWCDQSAARKTLIRNLLKKQMQIFEDKLTENLRHQTKLIEVQETHLGAIENSNDKLKQLIREQESCKRELDVVELNRADGRYKDRNETDSVARSLSRCELREDSLVPPKFGKKKVAWT